MDLTEIMGSQRTLDAVRAELLKRRSAEPPRTYLGASSIGHECDRYLWYLCNGFTRQDPHINAVTAAEGGYKAEPILIERLRMVPGVEVISHQPDGSQYEFSDFDGRFKGHPDGFICGILEAPKTWHVLEFKEKEEKFYNALWKLIQTNEKTALYGWNFEYYVQAQIYMRKFDLDRHYLVCTTPGARKMISCRTELNVSVADHFIARAKMILEAKTTPERKFKTPDFYKCKWCDFRGECWG